MSTIPVDAEMDRPGVPAEVWEQVLEARRKKIETKSAQSTFSPAGHMAPPLTASPTAASLQSTPNKTSQRKQGKHSISIKLEEIQTPTKTKGASRKRSASDSLDGTPSKRTKPATKSVKDDLNRALGEWDWSVRKYAETRNFNIDMVDYDDLKTIIEQLQRSKTGVQSSHLAWKSAMESSDQMAKFVKFGRTWTEAQ